VTQKKKKYHQQKVGGQGGKGTAKQSGVVATVCVVTPVLRLVRGGGGGQWRDVKRNKKETRKGLSACVRELGRGCGATSSRGGKVAEKKAATPGKKRGGGETEESSPVTEAPETPPGKRGKNGQDREKRQKGTERGPKQANTGEEVNPYPRKENGGVPEGGKKGDTETRKERAPSWKAPGRGERDTGDWKGKDRKK